MKNIQKNNKKMQMLKFNENVGIQYIYLPKNDNKK